MKKGNKIPAMTSDKVHNYLYELGTQWKGQGVAMELGCWLGASSSALLKGLEKAGYDRPFWAYDRWAANAEQVKKAKAQGVSLRVGENTELVYVQNTKHLQTKIITTRGNLPETLKAYVEDIQDEISICIFDAPKQNPIFSECMEKLTPYFIPGVTILGLLDYRFHERHTGNKRRKFYAPVKYMQKHKEFKIIQQWEDECPVFFKYLG